MAKLSEPDRLQPSLLDRLTDDAPAERVESREQRAMSLERLRQAVIRDLGWLLNTGNLTGVEDFAACPLVAKSVINYGAPELTGSTASSVDIRQVERLLKQAIIDFEPRLKSSTVKVKAVESDDLQPNSLAFSIEAEMYAQPLPLRLFLKTEVDLETGRVAIDGDARRS